MTLQVSTADGQPQGEQHRDASLGTSGLAAAYRAIDLPNVDLVIFDCDGVLIDSETIASRTIAKVLQTVGIAMEAAAAYRLFTGNAESDTRSYLSETLGIHDVDGFFETYNKQLYAEFEQIAEMDGIADVVTAIDRPLCVASNSTLYRLTRSLGRTSLWMAFRGQIFSADQVAKPKPAPDLLLHCAREMNAAPARSIMIDDGTHGILAAVAPACHPSASSTQTTLARAG